MIRFLMCMISLALITIPVMAQIYNGKSDELRFSLDQAVNEENALYSNILNPGENEDIKENSVRYQEMTNAVNEANERHFEMTTDVLK